MSLVLFEALCAQCTEGHRLVSAIAPSLEEAPSAAVRRLLMARIRWADAETEKTQLTSPAMECIAGLATPAGIEI